MDLDFRTIRSFRAVVTSGSFTGAAEQLGISQPTMTQQIRRLEDQLGFPLFTRSTRRVALSRHGEDFLPIADRFIAAHADTVAEARRLRSRLGRSLRIGTSFATGGIAARNDMLADFATSHAGIDLHVANDSQNAVIDAVAAGTIDAAIVLGSRSDPTDYARMRHPPGSFPDAPNVMAIARRRIRFLVDNGQGRTIDLCAFAGQQVAMIAPRMCPPLLEPIARQMKKCGVELVYPPEAENAVAVEEFGRRRRIPAISLGWFEPPDREDDVVWIESICVETELAMLVPAAPLTASQLAFVEHCQTWKEGQVRSDSSLSF